MKRIAVVGGIGSGKTYAARLFGLPVFNADNEVSKIYKGNKLVHKKLKIKLPNFIFSFPIKKKQISDAVKSHPKNLNLITKNLRKQKLNGTVSLAYHMLALLCF